MRVYLVIGYRKEGKGVYGVYSTSEEAETHKQCLEGHPYEHYEVCSTKLGAKCEI